MKNGDLLGEGVCRSHLLPGTLQEAPLPASLRYPFSATPISQKSLLLPWQVLKVPRTTFLGISRLGTSPYHSHLHQLSHPWVLRGSLWGLLGHQVRLSKPLPPTPGALAAPLCGPEGGPRTAAGKGPGAGPRGAKAQVPAPALPLALSQLMIILGCKRAGEREPPTSQLFNHWLHLRYVSSLGVPCFNVAALVWGTWVGERAEGLRATN